MKTKLRFAALFIVAGVYFIACPTPHDNSTPVVPPDPVDSAFWFGEINDELIIRIGEIDSNEYTGPTGNAVGQIANCQYVCTAINAKWGTSFQPVSGTALQAANVEYLLKMVDKANNNVTNYGTSSYATKQVVDVVAVNDAVNRLWKPGGKFVAIVTNSNKAAYSTDGINWVSATLPSDADWSSVCYGNGKFIAVTGNSNRAAYSTDGINWTETTMPSNANWFGICYGNGKFVAVTGNSNSNKAAYSTDGINWTATTLLSNAEWYSVCYGDGKFIAVGKGTNIAARSFENIFIGFTWTAVTLPSSANWHSVCYGGD
jgi:hypothetical protein